MGETEAPRNYYSLFPVEAGILPKKGYSFRKFLDKK